MAILSQRVLVSGARSQYDPGESSSSDPQFSRHSAICMVIAARQDTAPADEVLGGKTGQHVPRLGRQMAALGLVNWNMIDLMYVCASHRPRRAEGICGRGASATEDEAQCSWGRDVVMYRR